MARKHLSIAAAVLVAAMLTTGCGAREDPGSASESIALPESSLSESSTSESGASVAQPDAAGENAAATDNLAMMRRVLGENGIGESDIESRITSPEYAYYGADAFDAYSTSGMMGLSTLILYLRDSGEYRVVDLGPWSLNGVTWVAPHSDGPDGVSISVDGKYFGGDYSFQDLPRQLTYSLSTGTLTPEEVIDFPEGAYGMTHTRDHQRFKDVTVADNAVTFTFSVVEGGRGNGYDGPEILIASQWDAMVDDVGTPEGVIGFRNTEFNIPAETIAAIQVMDGVHAASFTYVESRIFTGTQLVIRPETGYRLRSAFNASGNTTILEDFRLWCEPDPFAE